MASTAGPGNRPDGPDEQDGNDQRLAGKQMLLLLLGTVSLPDPFDCVREKLLLGVANTVASTTAEQVLVFVALLLERLGHPVIGFHPVVHTVSHRVGVE